MDLLCLAKGAAELQSQSTLNKGIIKMRNIFGSCFIPGMLLPQMPLMTGPFAISSSSMG
jgi:hypothetical protein